MDLKNLNSWHFRMAIAADPKTPPESLKLIAEFEDDWFILRAICRNPNVCSQTLKMLATNNNWLVRSDVARVANVLRKF